MRKPSRTRRAVVLGGTAALSFPAIVLGQAKPVVRIGVPTKTYFPTIIAETAIRQKLFEKEGIKAELTIYRSGAEGFEAIAAGAAEHYGAPGAAGFSHDFLLQPRVAESRSHWEGHHVVQCGAAWCSMRRCPMVNGPFVKASVSRRESPEG